MPEHLKISDVKAGDVLIADGGFTCIDEGAELTVSSVHGDLWIPCRAGNHFLHGQADRGHYVGLSKKPAPEPTGPQP